MKSSRTLWRVVGSIAAFSTLLFIFGFIYAAQDVINPKPSDFGEEPSSTSGGVMEMFPKGDVTIVALGDSLTKGTGDLSLEGGYAGKAAKKLEVILKKPVHVINQAINGWRADNLLNSLEEPNIQNLIKSADIIMLTIGGNDLNHAADNPIDVTDTKIKVTPAPSETPGSNLEINYAEIKKSLSASEEKMAKILTTIATLNPNAKIVYVGLYNPYYEQDTKKEGTAILQDWNLKASQVASAYPNMLVVPTFDLFQLNIKYYLYIDEFHPNLLGYERIADRVVQALSLPLPE
ncbi:lipase [Paenibacillus psychroresistens]|uniref:Lipase n=1 Tax=Paenibacillus psychroresistens TaxID=1778678 RepID=A0A6B8RMM9_9BACL|nr:GDSL-type esterase/lipase family protein [Paenibacillus psychroresistens]QGQ96803.1 lipase [Paenibacillus psychroresistens]